VAELALLSEVRPPSPQSTDARTARKARNLRRTEFVAGPASARVRPSHVCARTSLARNTGTEVRDSGSATPIRISVVHVGDGEPSSATRRRVVASRAAPARQGRTRRGRRADRGRRRARPRRLRDGRRSAVIRESRSMLSTITASNDLTSIFRKLQLDSRSELRATLAGGSPVPA
jgi:hypothetical protein